MPVSKEELWRRYVEKNPHWLTDGATLTAAGLKRLFDQTYELGHRQGFENGRAKAEMEAAGRKPPLFESIFGKRVFDRG